MNNNRWNNLIAFCLFLLCRECTHFVISVHDTVTESTAITDGMCPPSVVGDCISLYLYIFEGAMRSQFLLFFVL